LPPFPAAIFAIEENAFVVDQDRQARVSPVPPQMRAIRAGCFLIAVSFSSNSNPE
jgi:hypothetical protein